MRVNLDRGHPPREEVSIRLQFPSLEFIPTRVYARGGDEFLRFERVDSIAARRYIVGDKSATF